MITTTLLFTAIQMVKPVWRDQYQKQSWKYEADHFLETRRRIRREGIIPQIQILKINVKKCEQTFQISQNTMIEKSYNGKLMSSTV